MPFATPRQYDVAIGLGSNLGEGPENLQQAVQLMTVVFGSEPRLSAVFYSEPVEVTEQPWFFNQVALFQLPPEFHPTKVLRELKQIEQQMGRVPTVRYGPRLIDLDLLIYGDWVMETANLVIPHLKMTERSFVLMPLLELKPEFIHPRLGKSLAVIYNEIREQLAECKKWSL